MKYCGFQLTNVILIRIFKGSTGAKNSISLDYLLQNYTKSEPLGRVYNCEKCRMDASQRTRRQSVRTEAAKRITVLGPDHIEKCLLKFKPNFSNRRGLGVIFVKLTLRPEKFRIYM